MTRRFDVLEAGDGIKQLVHEALYERIPCGARFRYVTGSMLVFAFVTQMITGIILWMAYSPSSQTAWESVYYIQHQMTGGWFLRGVHHFMAQAMIVLLGLHLLQVVIDKAYKAPREVNFWLGLILMQIVLALSLTGYLLPWDQKGYWATNVATNLMTLVPFGIGEKLQQLVVGGSQYGHHTLTRFFAMHAGVLPLLLLAFLGMHIAVFRKHGITAKLKQGRPDQFFWPNQVLFDAIGCLVLVVVVIGLVIHFDFGAMFSGDLSSRQHGADLGAPADASEPYGAARPEWYFLFLFQFLKYFHGNLEIFGAIIIPGALMTSMFFMPFVGKLKHGHKINVGFVFFLLGGAGLLTFLAINDDNNNDEYKVDVANADKNSARIHELMQRRVRLENGELSEPLMASRKGAIGELRNDPLTQGPKLFKRLCASCHSNDDGKGNGIKAAKPSAPNLHDFGTREWIRGLLDPKQIDGDAYFGNTAHRDGRMVKWVKEHLTDADWKKEHLGADEAAQDASLDAIAAALAAQAQHPLQDETDEDEVARGVKLIKSTCATYCHRFGDAGQLGLGPDLTGYGSYEWMMGLISDPTHKRFYRRENDRMPSFAKDLNDPASHTISVRELSLIVDWLRGDYYSEQDRRLPHNESEAWQAVRLARATDAELMPSPIGEVVDEKEQQRRQAVAVFKQNCSACHSHLDENGFGIASKNPSAPNLYHFASREWLTGFLDPDQINTVRYFGNTRHATKGDMVGVVKDDLSDLDDAGKANLKALIAALSAEAKLPYQEDDDQAITKGREVFEAGFDTYTCADCHLFGELDKGEGGPDLTGWGSTKWLTEFISNPTAGKFYGEKNDRMPAFAAHGDAAKNGLMTAEEIELLVRWLRGEFE
ncbi:MAG: cytochrome b N-terminal domain-containing protein [Planctomycetes bacterium]|nr:cytochrome b N-terminal domain-containing protein [Planctomycetota bacterium]